MNGGPAQPSEAETCDSLLTTTTCRCARMRESETSISMDCSALIAFVFNYRHRLDALFLDPESNAAVRKCRKDSEG